MGVLFEGRREWEKRGSEGRDGASFSAPALLRAWRAPMCSSSTFPLGTYHQPGWVRGKEGKGGGGGRQQHPADMWDGRLKGRHCSTGALSPAGRSRRTPAASALYSPYVPGCAGGWLCSGSGEGCLTHGVISVSLRTACAQCCSLLPSKRPAAAHSNPPGAAERADQHTQAYRKQQVGLGVECWVGKEKCGECPFTDMVWHHCISRSRAAQRLACAVAGDSPHTFGALRSWSTAPLLEGAGMGGCAGRAWARAGFRSHPCSRAAHSA